MYSAERTEMVLNAERARNTERHKRQKKYKIQKRHKMQKGHKIQKRNKMQKGFKNMEKKMKLPIGIENFKKIRKDKFYYVDKTGLIAELLNNWGEVNLFTRPRRFGKSLNMSMLKYFFEYGCDSTLFDGLKIADEQELCEEYMGKYPVISVTLKDASARDYKTAQNMLCSIIGNEAMRFQFLSESSRLSGREKEQYEQLVKIGGRGEPPFIMSAEVLAGSLQVLTNLLEKHYGQQVILLIDEYDVPLDKAQQYGYYDEMADMIRKLLGQVLKSNASLKLAVLTGCLRVAKESIFTGLNNLQVFSITNLQFDEHFGFTDAEVKAMLEYYGMEDKLAAVKEWYDGYRFGNKDVYCPWDVINYCSELRFDKDALPRSFWINTSGNDIIRKFIRQATPVTRTELERLISGETVLKKISQELTYRDLYKSIDNLWSVLFTTGYLTQRGKQGTDIYKLAIPNLEIRQIFIEQILEWFQEEVRRDTPKLDAFCAAFPRADAQAVEEQFNAYLNRTISIRDTCVRKDMKENFYHGILLGLLSHREDWLVDSNPESGDSYSDILVELYEERIGIVIEVKYSDGGDLETGCRNALAQIKRNHYEDRLIQDGMETIISYGIACCRKQCRVYVKSENLQLDAYK